MKRFSVKLRLTLWITLLMFLLTALVLVCMVAVSRDVVTENAYDQLTSVVQSNIGGISKENGSLTFAEGFSFTQNGVYTTVYSDAGALLAGQLPLGFPEGVAFENGISRPVEGENGDFYVLDLHLPFSWEDGVWVRGIIAAPDVADVLDDLTGIALLLLPLMVVISGVGAYLLARSTFRPIDRIINAAETIGEGRDLSRRIGLPPGRDEISRLGQAFDSMFARLETSFEAEKQFTSDASHELRTPTAVILAQCEDARRHAETPEQYAQAVEVIERQARRMSGLIAQLLQMTRLEQGTQRAAFEHADLSALTEVICEETPTADAVLQTDIQPDIEADFDVTLVSRLLQNLLNNAVRYGGGHIWVTLRRDGADAVLSVRDDGAGIPADLQDKIWQRFYQADTSRSGENGAGLGLPMVRQIAALHGGTVSLTSAPGKGSCFTFRFPTEQA